MTIQEECFEWNKKHNLVEWEHQSRKFMIEVAELEDAVKFGNIEDVADEVADCCMVLNAMDFISREDLSFHYDETLQTQSNMSKSDVYKLLELKTTPFVGFCDVLLFDIVFISALGNSNIDFTTESLLKRALAKCKARDEEGRAIK